MNYIELNEEADLLSRAEAAVGLISPEMDSLSGDGPFIPAILSSCSVGLLTPVYQVTNVILTLTNVDTSGVYDIFTVSNLNVSNWTWLVRGTNGQTVFVVTNPPVPESYYFAVCTNDTDGDLLSDAFEILTSKTNPQDPDTDYDGRSDSEEPREMTNPLDFTSLTQTQLCLLRFNDTNWLGNRGQVPLVSSNLHLVDGWITKAVELNTNGALLRYRDVEAGGAANINLRSGTLRAWFKPQWNSGTGPGTAAKLIEVGSRGASATNGWWALLFDGTGATLSFVSQTNNTAETTNLTGTVSFVPNNWYQVVLTFTNGAFALYTNGVLCATNSGTLKYPGLASRQGGFTVGGDGTNSVKGVIEDLEAFNYPLSTNEIVETFQLTQPPNLIPNLRMWLKADVDALTNSFGQVDPWRDQSGNANHASQSMVNNRPLYAQSALNGKPAIYFPGTNNYFTLPSTLFTSVTEAEAFVCLKADSATPTNTRGLWYLSGNGSYYPDTNGSISDGVGSFNKYHTPVAPIDLAQPHIYNVSARSNEWACRLNGIAHFSTNNNLLQFNSGTIWLGNGASDHLFAGHIGEVLIFSRTLTTTERYAVENYLSQRFSLFTNPPPSAANLSAWAVSTNQISLTWSNALSNTNLTFIVQRKTDGSAYNDVAFVRNGLAYLDSDLAASTSYSYRIKSLNYSGGAAFSVETNATTLSTGAAIPLASLRVWLKADCGHGFGPVNCWVDQTTNNNSANMENTPGIQAPTWSGFNSNGNPAVFFAGTNDFLLPPFLSSATQAEAFVVVKSYGQTNANWVALWLMGFGAAPSRYPTTNNLVQDNFGRSDGDGSTLFSPGLADLSVTHLFNPMSKPGRWEAWVNNVPRYTNSVNTPGFRPANLYCRLGQGDSTVGKYLVGEISEVMIFDRELTAGERDTVATNYFRKRFNLW